MKSSWILALSLLCACSTGPTRKAYSPYGSNTNGNENANSGSTSTASPNASDSSSRPAPPTKSDALKKAQAAYAKADYSGSYQILRSIDDAELRPSDRTEYWNLKGLVELGFKNAPVAETSFRKAIQANTHPEYAGYYQYNLATSLTEQQKKEEALQVLNSIDASKMDVPDQRKIVSLKEKLGANAFTGTPGASPSPGATPANAKPVYEGDVNASRIGLLLPLSGKYESFGKKAQRAIELAFQHSDSAKSREVELVPMDSGDTPASQQEAIRKLVEEQKVIGIIGPLLSKGIESLSEKADYYQVPLISIAQVQAPVSPSLFSCSVSTRDQAAKVAEYATKARGFRRFAILGPSNKAGEEMTHDFWTEVEKNGGEVRAFELYQPELTDFREPVDKVLGLFYKETRAKDLEELAKQRTELKITKKTMKTQQYFTLPPIIDFDAVFIADEPRTAGQVIPTFAYRDAKNLTYLGISSWNSNQLISRAQEQVEGAVFPVAFNTLNPPAETKRFYELYSTTYAAAPGELDAIAYDAAAVMLKVISDGPSTRKDFRNKLESIGEVTAATGTVSIKEHRCSRNLALYTVKKGQFQVVDTTAAQEQK